LLPARTVLRALVLTGLAVALTGPATAANAEPSASEVQQKIEKASGQLEDVVESYNKINEELKATRAAATSLAAKTEALSTQLVQSQDEVGQLAASAYKAGRLGGAGALLSASGEDGDLVRGLDVLAHLAQEQEEQVQTFTSTERQYAEEKARLEAAERRQSAQATEIAARKKKIDGDLKKLYELRRQVYGQATSSGSSYSGSIPSVSGKSGSAVTFAYNAIGKPYSYGAEGPSGYDCSGLTLAAWAAAGKPLPHNAAMQWDVVTHISRSALKPGDLVFYRSLGHVALFVGSGKIIHAPNAGESVKLASVDVMAPYGYGRV